MAWTDVARFNRVTTGTYAPVIADVVARLVANDPDGAEQRMTEIAYATVPSPRGRRYLGGISAQANRPSWAIADGPICTSGCSQHSISSSGGKQSTSQVCNLSDDSSAR